MSATFLIAVSNGLALLPKMTCHYCTRPATNNYQELPLCIGHYYAVDRANE